MTEPLRRCLQILAIAELLVFIPCPTVAQSVVIDEGTFEISIDGRPAGTEDFSIRRAGVGRNTRTIATGEITINGPDGRLDLRPALQVMGGTMSISAYQMKISGSRDEEVFVTAGNRRFLLRMRSDRGEQERELRATPGTLLLDTSVAHQHYFLVGRRAESGRSLAVIVPRQGRQYELTIADAGRESVQIAGQTVDARHLELSVGQATRDVWLDSEGRVLRVVSPSSGYAAVRTALP